MPNRRSFIAFVIALFAAPGKTAPYPMPEPVWTWDAIVRRAGQDMRGKK